MSSLTSIARRYQLAPSRGTEANLGTPRLLSSVTPTGVGTGLIYEDGQDADVPKIMERGRSTPNLTALRQITSTPFHSAPCSVRASAAPNRRTIPSAPVEMFVEGPQEILGNGDLFRLFQKFREVNPEVKPNNFLKKFKAWLKQFQRVDQNIYKKLILKLNAVEKKLAPVIQVAIFNSSSYPEVFQKITDTVLEIPSYYRSKIEDMESESKAALRNKNYGEEMFLQCAKRGYQAEWQDRAALIKHLYKLKAFIYLFAQTDNQAEKAALLRLFFTLDPFKLKKEDRDENIVLLEKIKNYYSEALGIMQLHNFFGVDVSTFPAWFTRNPGVRGERISTPFLEELVSRADSRTNLTPFHFYLMFNLIDFDDDEFIAAKTNFSEEITRLWPGLNSDQIMVTPRDIESVVTAIRLNLIPAFQRMGYYSDLKFFNGINGGSINNYHSDLYTHQEDPILIERGLAADEYTPKETDLTAVFTKKMESLKKEFRAVRRGKSHRRDFTGCWGGGFEWDNLQCMQGRLLLSMPPLTNIEALVPAEGISLTELKRRSAELPTLAQSWRLRSTERL